MAMQFEKGWNYAVCVKVKLRHNPGNVPPLSKSEDSFFCKTNKTHGMKVNITIASMYHN